MLPNKKNIDPVYANLIGSSNLEYGIPLYNKAWDAVKAAY